MDFRYSVWTQDDHEPGPCPSNIWRHWNCIFGIEDLHRLARLPHFFVNKMMPEHDFGAIVCWYEYMFNMSYLEPQTSKNLNMDYYLSMPHVRYHKEKLKNGFINIRNFDCSFKYKHCIGNLNCTEQANISVSI